MSEVNVSAFSYRLFHEDLSSEQMQLSVFNHLHADKLTSQWREMYCHDLEVMSSNPGRVKLWVRSTLSCT